MNRETEFERLLAEYLRAAALGPVPPPEVWAAGYPEYRDELLEFFALRKQFQGLTEEVRVAISPPSPPRSPPAPGFPIAFGKYTLRAELGRGGMGVVYRADLANPRREVALKMIRDAALATPRDRARFHNEIETSARLSHPHIVPVFDFGELDGHPYYTMPVFHGDLGAHRETHAEPHAAGRLLRNLARAAEHANRHGILHRDIKPSNVLFDDAGSPYLSDFGLAKVDSVGDLTRTGELVGNPIYMPPEHANGKQASAAGDVYGLGGVLYFALTGRGPVDEGPLAVVLERARTSPPRPPRSLNPAVPRDLEAVCLKCLAKEPNDRYGTAAELADDLDRFLAGLPVRARPISRTVRFARWVGRHPLEAATIAGIAVVTTVALAVALVQWQGNLRTEADLVAAKARADGESALRAAAQSQAETAEFLVALEQLRDSRLSQKPGWRTANLASVRRLASRPIALAHAHLIRTEAAAALAAPDPGVPREVANGFKAYAAAFSSDGQSLALGGWESGFNGEWEVRFYDPDTGRELRRLGCPRCQYWLTRAAPSGEDGCRALTMSPDGNWLVAGTRSGWVVRWNLQEKHPKPERRRHAPPTSTGPQEARKEAVRTLAFDARGRLWSGSGVTVVGWEFENAWRELERHNRTGVEGVEVPQPGGPAIPATGPRPVAGGTSALCPNGTLAVGWGGVRAGRLSVWHTRENRRLSQLPTSELELGEEDGITDLVWSPDGRLVVSAAEHFGTVRGWDPIARRSVFSRVLATGGSLRIAFRPGGRELAVLTEECTLIYSIPGATISNVVGLQAAALEDADTSADGRVLVATGGNPNGQTSVLAWELTDPSGPARPIHTDVNDSTGYGEPRCVCVTRDGVFAPHLSGAGVHRWRIRQYERSFLGAAAGVRALAASPDGTVLTLLPDCVRVFRPGGEPESVTSGIELTALVAVGEEPLVGRVDGSVCRITQNGKLEIVSNESTTAVTAVASADGASYYGTRTGGLHVRRNKSADVALVDGHSGQVTSISPGPRGWFATGSSDRAVRIWTPTGQPVLTLAHAGPIQRVFWLPDGHTLLVLVRGERALRRWHLGELTRELKDLGVEPDLP